MAEFITIALDLAKEIFQAHGTDAAVVSSSERGYVESRFFVSGRPRSFQILMEAYPGFRK